MDEVSEDEQLEVAIDILNKDIGEELIARVIEERTAKSNGSIILKEGYAGYYVIDDFIDYNEFLKQIHKSTGIPMNVMHKAFCEYSKRQTITDGFFNKKTLTKFITLFQQWFEDSFVKRFSYKALDVEITETALTNIDGEVKENIVQGNIGIYQDDSMAVPDKFLYDSVVFDSPKEKESIVNSNIDEVVVFGKIPRRSVQVPLYFGGTTSPDFMYLLRKDGKDELNFIVETKDVQKESSLRNEEKLRIESAKQFFETLKVDGVNVRFEKQLKADGMEKLIRKVLDKKTT